MSESEEPKDMEEFIVEGVLMLGVSIAGVILNIIRSLFIIAFPSTSSGQARITSVSRLIRHLQIRIEKSVTEDLSLSQKTTDSTLFFRPIS